MDQRQALMDPLMGEGKDQGLAGDSCGEEDRAEGDGLGDLKRRSTWSCGDFVGEQGELGEQVRLADQGEDQLIVNGSMGQEACFYRNDPQKMTGLPAAKNPHNDPTPKAPKNPSQYTGRPTLQRYQSQAHPNSLSLQAQLESANKENKTTMENLTYLYNVISKILLWVQQGRSSVDQAIGEAMGDRRRDWAARVEGTKGIVKGLEEEAGKWQKEYEEKYKQLDLYFQVKKQKQINQRLTVSIVKKQQQLAQLQAHNQQTHTQISNLLETSTSQLTTKKHKKSSLESHKETLEQNLHKWQQNRFNLNRKFLRQERLNRDIDEQIQTVDEKIEKEIKFDEKIRLCNLRALEMLECQAGRNRDQLMNHERLRAMQEANHGLKLKILNLTQDLQHRQEECQRVVPAELGEKKAKKLNELRHKVAASQNKLETMKSKAQEVEEIKAKIRDIKDEEKFKEDSEAIRFEIQSLEGQGQALQKQKSDLKEEIKDISERLETVKADVQEKLKRKELEKQIAKQKQKQRKAIEIQKQEQMNRQKLNPKGSKKPFKKISKLSKQQNLNTGSNQKKPLSMSFLLTVFYLLILVVIACNYTKIEQQARNWYNSPKPKPRLP